VLEINLQVLQEITVIEMKNFNTRAMSNLTDV